MSDAERILTKLQGIEVPPEPEHDAAYWRGALRVIREREQRIAAELSNLEASRIALEQLRELTAKAKSDAVLHSRNALTRAQAAKLLGVAPGTITAMVTAELRRRGMGAGR